MRSARPEAGKVHGHLLQSAFQLFTIEGNFLVTVVFLQRQEDWRVTDNSAFTLKSFSYTSKHFPIDKHLSSFLLCMSHLCAFPLFLRCWAPSLTMERWMFFFHTFPRNIHLSMYFFCPSICDFLSLPSCKPLHASKSMRHSLAPS